MDRIQELERVLENIIELFEGNQVETDTGDIVFVSDPLLEAIADAEDVLYGDGSDDDATGVY